MHVEGEPVLGGVAPVHDRRRWSSSTSSGSASARNPTCPRLTPSSGVARLAGELGGAQDRAVAAEDQASSQPRAGVGVGGRRPRSRRRSRRGRVPSSAASAAEQPDQQPVRRSATGRTRGPRRGRPRGRCARPAGRAARRRRLRHSRVHLLTRRPRSGAVRATSARTSSASIVGRAPAQPQEELDVARRARQRAGGDRRGPPAAPRRPRRRPRATASARSSGSRTTPPLPTRSWPTSNCGLTISTRSPSARVTADQRRRGPASSEMKDRSPTTRSTGPPIGSRGRAPGRWCGRGPRPASSCCSRQASWP